MNFAALIDMQVLPESSKDSAVIRLLGDKHKCVKAFDEQDSKAFMSRFFTRYTGEEQLSGRDPEVEHPDQAESGDAQADQDG